MSGAWGACALAVVLVLAPSPVASAALRPGDFVMVSPAAIGGYPYRVVVLAGASPSFTEISSGGLLNGATDIAVTPSGAILVTVPSVGVVTVDPTDGQQTVFAALGSLGDGIPSGIAAGPDGAVYVIMQSGVSRVVQLAPDGTLDRTVTTGGFLPLPAGLVAGGDGSLYVCATIAYGAGGGGGLVRVDLASGAQTPIASNAILCGPFHVALAPDGWLWTVQFGRFSQRREACVARTRISDGYTERMPYGLCGGHGIAIRWDGVTVVGDCERISGDCYDKFTFEYPSGSRVEGISGPVAVVPDGVTPSMSTTWGRLKVLYR